MLVRLTADVANGSKYEEPGATESRLFGTPFFFLSHGMRSAAVIFDRRPRRLLGLHALETPAGGDLCQPRAKLCRRRRGCLLLFLGCSYVFVSSVLMLPGLEYEIYVFPLFLSLLIPSVTCTSRVHS